jgi:Surface antigen variable number repeat
LFDYYTRYMLSGVARQMYLRFAAIALLAILIPILSHANPQECNGSSPRPIDTQQIKISIASVEFPVGDTLPEEIRTQLRRNVEKEELTVASGAPDTDWLSELNDVIVREVLQNAGYFKAQTHTTPYLIRAEAQQRSYAVRIEAASGPQYRLGEVQFANVTAFTQDDLRKEVRVVRGEIFDAAKIREAIESVVRLYSTKGHIDATIEPQIEIDDEKQRIDLTMKVSEEAQYRVGTVEVLGVEGGAKHRLVGQLEPGRIFDVSVLRSFLEENASTLPEGASIERNVSIHRRTRDRTVDIVLDVRKTGCIGSARPMFDQR